MNKIFAFSNWTIGEAKFYNSLSSAIDNAETNEDDTGIVEMELQGNEFVPVKWYSAQGDIL